MVERAPRPQDRIRRARQKGALFLLVLAVLVGLGFGLAGGPGPVTWSSDVDLAAWSVVGQDVTPSRVEVGGGSDPRGRLLRVDVVARTDLASDLIAVPRCDVLDGTDEVPETTTPIADAVVVLPLTSPIPVSLQPGDSATLHRPGSPVAAPVVFTGSVGTMTGANGAVAYGEFLIESEDVRDYAGDRAWLVVESAPEC